VTVPVLLFAASIGVVSVNLVERLLDDISDLGCRAAWLSTEFDTVLPFIFRDNLLQLGLKRDLDLRR